MAKHIVKANHTGNQVRITLPALLIKEMKWERITHFYLAKTSKTTAKIVKLFEKEDMGCK